MEYKNNVIYLDYVRAVRDAVEKLHSSEMRGVIYAGASSEFNRVVAPVIRNLLESKGASPEFQKTIISLLQKVYATHHIDDAQTDQMITKINAFLEKAT